MTPKQFRDQVVAEFVRDATQRFNNGDAKYGGKFLEVNGDREAWEELVDLGFYLKKGQWDKGRAVERAHRALGVLPREHPAYTHVAAIIDILETGKE